MRAQRRRGGRGRPRARQVAGWPRKCRRTGGSSGGSGDCSCSSLRIFLGQVQDGGAACTGFPVTLAMGRTTKEGGRRMRAQLAEPGKRWPGPGSLATPLPQFSPLDLSRRLRGPPGWSSRLKGRREAPMRKRSLLRMSAWKSLRYVLGHSGMGLSL